MVTQAQKLGTVLVTGATGHLGNVLVRLLCEQQVPTRVLVRQSSPLAPLEGLAVERVLGDVTDPQALERAVAGVDTVFHLAGLVSITAGQRERLTRVNVQGTQNVIDACLAAKVRRLVYMSSVHALTEPEPGGVLTETLGFDPATAYGPYGESKAAASKLVQDAAKAGLIDAVLVLPTGVLGPFDFQCSEAGQLVSLSGQGKVPIIVAGGYDWVDVRDVAIGTLAAALRGRSGEAYLLNNRSVSNVELCAIVANAAHAAPPRFALPLWLARVLSYGGLLWERVTGRRALLTPYAVHALGKTFSVSAQKAQRELQFEPRPIEQTLADAWAWLHRDPHSPLRRSLRLAPGRVLAFEKRA